MNLGATELLIILAVVLLLFGSTRLPKLARSLGQASKEFKHGVHEPLGEDVVVVVDDTAADRPGTPKTGI
ncbi:MAG: twin-arginine translocase TatA/TatE family subunit [Acidimicrobiales bacterium]